MRIVNKAKVEDCFDGGSVYRYEFDEGFTKSVIHLLGVLGELEYFSDFPRPLFRVTSAGGLMVKGVEGEQECRVIYPRQGAEAARGRFESRFDS